MHKVQRNQLNVEKMLTVMEQVRPMKDEITSGKHSPSTLADHLSEKLEFTITATNLKFLCRKMGFPFPSHQRHGKNINTVYYKLVARIDDLEARLVVLETALK